VPFVPPEPAGPEKKRRAARAAARPVVRCRRAVRRRQAALRNPWQLLQSSFLSSTCLAWTFEKKTSPFHSFVLSRWQLAQSGLPFRVAFGW